jgi:Trypsin
MKQGGALLLLVGVAACARPAPQPLRAAITHGTLDAGDPAVAALLLRVAACGASPVVYCTGTLVAPRALLTAGHCVDVAPVGAVTVFFGADARGAGEAHGVVASIRPADAGVDLALLALDEAAGVPPVALDLAPPPAPGTAVRLVGFGADDNGVVGAKRTGAALLDAVGDAELRVGPAPALSCGGDSGGPMLLGDGGGERVAGVASYGDAGCAVSTSYARLDTQSAFLGDALAQIAALPVATPRPSLEAGAGCGRACAGDRDCPLGFVCLPGGGCGLPGAAASSVGAACTSDATCAGGSCIALEGGCRCVTPCEPTRRSPGGCSFAGAAQPPTQPKKKSQTWLQQSLLKSQISPSCPHWLAMSGTGGLAMSGGSIAMSGADMLMSMGIDIARSPPPPPLPVPPPTPLPPVPGSAAMSSPLDPGGRVPPVPSSHSPSTQR